MSGILAGCPHCLWNVETIRVVARGGKRATLSQELQAVVHNTDGVIRWMATGFFVVFVVLSVKL